MNLHKHHDRLDTLAAHYALGSLRGGARRRFETLARELPVVRLAAHDWHARLASMTELQTGIAPNPVVWTRLQNLIAAEQSQKALALQRARAAVTPSSWWRNLLLWRGVSLIGTAVSVVAVLVGLNLNQQLQTLPRVSYVAVLADDQSAASMLVTFDPLQRKLTLQRVGGYQEASDKSLQLWALPPGKGPQSLGVLSHEKLLRLTVAEAQVNAVPTLAISLEPQGGVPSERGPTGPVLFKGALIQKSL